MRSTARSVRRPDPAPVPRAPRPGPGFGSGSGLARPHPLGAAGKRRPCSPHRGPGATLRPAPAVCSARLPAAPGPAPRPAPRAGAVLPPPPSPEKVAILVHCLRPPAVGASGPGCRPCPASGDRWVATGLQVLLLAALARLGEWPESAAAPDSL